MTLQALREALMDLQQFVNDYSGEWEDGEARDVSKRAVAALEVIREARALTVPGETEIDGLIASLIEATTVLGEPFHHDAIAATMTKAAEALRHLSSRSLDGWKATHQHVKRGGKYRVIGKGYLQTEMPLGDMDELTFYQGEDGKLWARPIEEFEDGRFTALKEAKPVHASQGKDDTK